MDEEAAILLRELEDVGSLGESGGEGVPVVSRGTSESNSRLTSPVGVEVKCVCTYVCSDPSPHHQKVEFMIES